MSVIHIPRRHFAQPQGRVAIAPEWAQDMRFCWSPGSPGLEMVTGQAIPYAGATVRGGREGAEYLHSGRIVLPAAWPRLDGSTGRALTMLCLADPRTESRMTIYAQRAVLESNHLEMRFNQGQFGPDANNQLAWRASSDPGYLAAEHVFTGEMTQFVGVLGQEQEFLYAAGRLLNQRTRGTACTPQPAAIGGLADSTAVQYTRSLGLLAGWHRALTPHEIAELNRAPYQIFRADPIRIYSFPTGPISLAINSITASNITSSGARITLGLTR